MQKGVGGRENGKRGSEVQASSFKLISHGNEKYSLGSIGDTVNNLVVMLYGDRWGLH